jgi:RHS repeat-associated protein
MKGNRHDIATGKCRGVRRTPTCKCNHQHHLFDREDVIAEFSNDTFSTVFRQTIHGPGIDEPLAIIGDRPGEYTYYLHDGLGSMTALVDADGNLDGCYDYGAFGDERRNTVAFENRYRYTSREYVEPNLYYYRARYMRPDLGRFVSMDPLKTIDGTNVFFYVKNSPLFKRDPMGMATTIIMDCDLFCHCYLVIGGTTFSNPGEGGVVDHNRQGGQYSFPAEPNSTDPCSTDCRDDCIRAVWNEAQKYYHWFFSNCCDHVRLALSACNCKVPDQIKHANGGV